MKIGIYYYPWYSGSWLNKTVRKNDPPSLGEYDNTMSEGIIDCHIKIMKEHLIDFMVVSWDPKMETELTFDCSARLNFPVSAMYETLYRSSNGWNISSNDMKLVLGDISLLGETIKCYKSSWLKIKDKPVVFIYVSRCFWENQKIKDIRHQLEKDIDCEIFLVGDEAFWGKEIDSSRVMLFDAVTCYNWYQPNRFSSGLDSGSTFLRNVVLESEKTKKLCDESGVEFWPNAIPGYDDRGVRPEKEHEPILRSEILFKDFLNYSLNLMVGESKTLMITSFNEWYEDTQIEPSESYGTKYLDIVKEVKLYQNMM